MNEPICYESRYLVWTDHAAQGVVGGRVGSWFWTASGPRGHMSGCEYTAEQARERAYAARVVLAETKPR